MRAVAKLIREHARPSRYAAAFVPSPCPRRPARRLVGEDRLTEIAGVGEAIATSSPLHRIATNRTAALLVTILEGRHKPGKPHHPLCGGKPFFRNLRFRPVNFPVCNLPIGLTHYLRATVSDKESPPQTRSPD